MIIKKTKRQKSSSGFNDSAFQLTNHNKTKTEVEMAEFCLNMIGKYLQLSGKNIVSVKKN